MKFHGLLPFLSAAAVLRGATASPAYSVAKSQPISPASDADNCIGSICTLPGYPIQQSGNSIDISVPACSTCDNTPLPFNPNLPCEVEFSVNGGTSVCIQGGGDGAVADCYNSQSSLQNGNVEVEAGGTCQVLPSPENVASLSIVCVDNGNPNNPVCYSPGSGTAGSTQSPATTTSTNNSSQGNVTPNTTPTQISNGPGSHDSGGTCDGVNNTCINNTSRGSRLQVSSIGKAAAVAAAMLSASRSWSR